MPKPFSLQTVLDLMQNRSDEATQHLARLIASERDAQSKLRMLEEYRDDYSERFRKAMQGGLRQPEWRNYQEFLQRLDEAINQQLQAVRQQQSQTASGQAEWRQQRKRLQAFDALYERHRSSEAKLEGRQEQKAQDELAARRKHDKDDDE